MPRPNVLGCSHASLAMLCLNPIPWTAHSEAEHVHVADSCPPASDHRHGKANAAIRERNIFFVPSLGRPSIIPLASDDGASSQMLHVASRSGSIRLDHFRAWLLALSQSKANFQIEDTLAHRVNYGIGNRHGRRVSQIRLAPSTHTEGWPCGGAAPGILRTSGCRSSGG